MKFKYQIIKRTLEDGSDDWIVKHRPTGISGLFLFIVSFGNWWHTHSSKFENFNEAKDYVTRPIIKKDGIIKERYNTVVWTGDVEE